MLKLVGGAGARSHETHLASHHIPELGQFIETDCPEEQAAGNDPWVTCPIHLRHGRVGGQQLLKMAPMHRGVRIRPHRPELVAKEATPAQSDAFLAEEHRPRGNHLDERRNEEADDGYQWRRQQNKDEVENPFPPRHYRRSG
jgi:hypothetical protein